MRAFWQPEADVAWLKSLRDNLRAGIPLIEMDCNINDPAFADRAVRELLAMLQGTAGKAYL